MLGLIIFVQIWLAVWLYRYFNKADRGSKESAKDLRIACLFGVLAVLLAGFINGLFVPETLLEGTAAHIDVMILFRAAIGVGLNEELLKFLPLAIYIYKRPYFNELTDGVVYFALAGMWFGVLENIQYTLQYGVGVGVLRIIVTPFLHAAFTSIAGIGLIRYKLVTKRFTTVIWWLSIAVGLHALYDFMIFSEQVIAMICSLLVAGILNWALFYFYRHLQRGDEVLGMSAVGSNRFCRQCGAANPAHHLYCTKCGQKA